jgi:hypothetical protein
MHMLDCQPPIQVLSELEVGRAASDPLRAGVLAMGLRFFRVAGWGWVAEMGGRVAGCAHPLEKPALGFSDTSIHRLSSDKVWVWWWGSGIVVGMHKGLAILVRRVLSGHGQ